MGRVSRASGKAPEKKEITTGYSNTRGDSSVLQFSLLQFNLRLILAFLLDE
jgi:hypothetical protein